MKRAPRSESGFVLPTAIFLLVVLAALAAYMVSLSRTSHISSALDVQGTRAMLAARAGIEWGAWQLLRTPVPVCDFEPPPQSCTDTLPPSPPSRPPLVLGGTLAPFSVTVSCTQLGPYTDGAAVTVYQITSTARSGAPHQVDCFERQIKASFSK